MMNALISFLLILLLNDCTCSNVSDKVRKALIDLNAAFEHQSLAQLYPDVKIQGRISSDCYDPELDRDTELNIFQSAVTVAKIVETYFNVHKNLPHKESKVKTRVSSFVENLKFLSQLVKKCMSSNETSKTVLGLTSMSAFSEDEYRLNFLNPSAVHVPPLKNPHHEFPRKKCFLEHQPKHAQQGNQFDWLNTKAQPVVQNQLLDSAENPCRASVYASIGALESAWNRCKVEPLQFKFSERAVMDCLEEICAKGGGTVQRVMRLLVDDGVTLEEDHQPGNCYTNNNNTYDVYTKADNFCIDYNVTNNIAVKNHLDIFGPSIVFIDASSRLMQFYRGGTFNAECNSSSVDYPMLLVGWKDGHWLLQNSWGNEWANGGIMWLPMGTGNLCGIGTQIVSPIFYSC